jgi:[ribosomal protein S18]-alanine N-acetyltransferase
MLWELLAKMVISNIHDYIMKHKLYTIRPTTDPEMFDRFSAMMAASDPWWTLGMDAAACRAGFDGPYKEVFIAYRDEAAMGFAILQTGGTFSGYIQTLFVLQPFRRQGFGKKLLRFCEDYVHETSPNIFICVSSFNTRALRLYQEVGFTLIGTLKDFLVPGFDELLLRKTIGPKIGYKR